MPRLQSHFGLQDPRFQSVVMPMIIPFVVQATATLTSPQLLQGMIQYLGAGAANITLPSAADLCNNIQGCMVGTTFEFMVRCLGAGAATVLPGAGGTMSGSGATPTVNTHMFMLNFTNVTIGQEAYTVYSEGTAAF